MTTDTLFRQLRQLVDAHGIDDVTGALADVCAQKCAQTLTTDPRFRLWERFALDLRTKSLAFRAALAAVLPR